MTKAGVSFRFPRIDMDTDEENEPPLKIRATFRQFIRRTPRERERALEKRIEKLEKGG